MPRPDVRRQILFQDRFYCSGVLLQNKLNHMEHVRKINFPVDERLNAWAKDARVVLGRELRATIEKISPDTGRTTGEQPAVTDNSTAD